MCHTLNLRTDVDIVGLWEEPAGYPRTRHIFIVHNLCSITFSALILRSTSPSECCTLSFFLISLSFVFSPSFWDLFSSYGPLTQVYICTHLSHSCFDYRHSYRPHIQSIYCKFNSVLALKDLGVQYNTCIMKHGKGSLPWKLR